MSTLSPSKVKSVGPNISGGPAPTAAFAFVPPPAPSAAAAAAAALAFFRLEAATAFRYGCRMASATVIRFDGSNCSICDKRSSATGVADGNSSVSGRFGLGRRVGVLLVVVVRRHAKCGSQTQVQ